jgi:hypothetical protein
VQPEPEKTKIELSVSLSDIVEIPLLQVRRKGLNTDTVKRYANILMNNGTLPHPKAVPGGHGKFILIDGFHRVAAARMINQDCIDLEIVTGNITSHEELRVLAFEANAHHGLPLTPAEHRDWFKAYIKANRFKKPNGTSKSLREIGREFGIAHTTVARRLQEHFPRLFEKWWANEELSFTGKTGGLKTMEYNAAHKIEANFNDSLTLIRQLEALGSTKGPELRGEILRQAEEIAQMCRSKDYTLPDF